MGSGKILSVNTLMCSPAQKLASPVFQGLGRRLHHIDVTDYNSPPYLQFVFHGLYYGQLEFINVRWKIVDINNLYSLSKFFIFALL